MKIKPKNNGSVFLMTVFVIALLTVLTMGMLQMNTEEIQLMRNQIYASQALAITEAGLNDAFAEIRADSSWMDGFVDKTFSFAGPAPITLSGKYTVTVSGILPTLTIESTGTTGQGFVARVAAEVTVASSGPPYVIRIDRLRINE